MTLSDSGQQASPTEAAEGQVDHQPTNTSLPPEGDAASTDLSGEAAAEAARRRILIGSQRDPAAYRARTKRDWTPVVDGEGKKREKRKGENKERKTDERPPVEAEQPLPPPAVAESEMQDVPNVPEVPELDLSEIPGLRASDSKLSAPAAPSFPLPRPSRRDADLDLEAELNRALGDASMDELLGGGSRSEDEAFEPDSLQTGRVVAVRRDDVFVEFAGRQQGILSVRLFDVPPRPGAEIQVTVQRLNPEDGLYELSLPNRAVQVDDWSDLVEGALIEVRVTGHNAGGLECEVNHIRGFIPVSQISLYRVEDLAPYVDQRLTCVITEANPERRNLVLSRRAVLEREKEQARDQMLKSLQPGQVFDGTVRKLMDFGAFVDLGGGVDGLVHVSQVAWARVKHPSDVLKEGQVIKVRVDKVDPATGKISLAYRDLLESPWTNVADKFPIKSVARGTVTKLMDFGAFVELEPGVEGLVHVSELSHKRVWRPSDVVKAGDQVDVLVLSIDTQAQRISLSMKACAAPPEPVKKEGDEEPGTAKPTKKKGNKPTGPLVGGLGKRTDTHFGLKW